MTPANDEFVIVLDSPDRENEGDLIIAAESLTPEKAAFMIRYSSGYICAPLPVSRAAALHLPQMVADNADPNRTAYAISMIAPPPVLSMARISCFMQSHTPVTLTAIMRS